MSILALHGSGLLRTRRAAARRVSNAMQPTRHGPKLRRGVPPRPLGEHDAKGHGQKAVVSPVFSARRGPPLARCGQCSSETPGRRQGRFPYPQTEIEKQLAFVQSLPTSLLDQNRRRLDWSAERGSTGVARGPFTPARRAGTLRTSDQSKPDLRFSEQEFVSILV